MSYGGLGLVIVGVLLCVLAALLPMDPRPKQIVNVLGIVAIVVGAILFLVNLLTGAGALA